METWRKVWRDGFLPAILKRDGGAAGLAALLDALRRDDGTLLQGATTQPPPLACVQDWPVEGADAVAFACWKGTGAHTVSDVGDEFARCCYEADRSLGEPAACRYFLNFWDDTPRDEARRLMAREVAYNLEALSGRDAPDPAASPGIPVPGFVESGSTTLPAAGF